MVAFLHRFWSVPYRFKLAAGLFLAGVLLVGCENELPGGEGSVEKSSVQEQDVLMAQSYAGTQSCRECHEEFYQLWEPSRHGTTMQPYTLAFAQKELRAQSAPLQIAGNQYQAHIGENEGFVREVTAQGETIYPVAHVLGGKYVYYFLTPLDRGYLQTLPLAYDTRTKQWFDVPSSGIRHQEDAADSTGQPVSWRDSVYTFNTACYSCHVSQFENTFDLATKTYTTSWKEPGINCESCHGPSAVHNEAMRRLPANVIPDDTKILGGKGKFTVLQNTDACAPCHAQMVPLTDSFMPGNSFYDHYDLVTLEDPDFYPDGRDLGENYTHTSWSLSGCVVSGQLGCLHCHTSSGRFRQKNDPDAACFPCHEDVLRNSSAHTRHLEGSPGDRCISCHMPKTTFARMERSDHSMLPPTPAATLEFGSPNACTLCHTDKDAQWAQTVIQKTRIPGYQEAVLHRAGLVDAARRQDWDRLPEMLEYISSPAGNSIFVTSLIRLVRLCDEEAKWPVLIAALEKNPSALVRGAAARALTGNTTPQAVQALVTAANDPVRLVRIHAAASLAEVSGMRLSKDLQTQVASATQEYVTSLTVRPDLWTSHYNLGNYYLRTGKPQQAHQAFATAHDIAPRAVAPLVNDAMALTQTGNIPAARSSLNKALETDPDNPMVLFNLGLLEAGSGHTDRAEKALRASLAADPSMARAAYNLSLLLGEQKPQEAIAFARQAMTLHPDASYAFNMAFILHRAGKTQQARTELIRSSKKWPEFTDFYFFLLELARDDRHKQELRSLVLVALGRTSLPPASRARLEGLLRHLDTS